MSDRPSSDRQKTKEAPAVQQEGSEEPPATDESIPADNRYAPASGILTPTQNPMPGAQ
jgi:hypothetical protein